ncbi:MAG: hypothetical protein H6717_09885 [Polyangiaceae bacterium]|nr:hypothetical protein [Polyangiaceae bacterium]
MDLDLDFGPDSDLPFASGASRQRRLAIIVVVILLLIVGGAAVGALTSQSNLNR